MKSIFFSYKKTDIFFGHDECSGGSTQIVEPNLAIILSAYKINGHLFIKKPVYEIFTSTIDLIFEEKGPHEKGKFSR